MSTTIWTKNSAVIALVLFRVTILNAGNAMFGGAFQVSPMHRRTAPSRTRARIVYPLPPHHQIDTYAHVIDATEPFDSEENHNWMSKTPKVPQRKGRSSSSGFRVTRSVLLMVNFFLFFRLVVSMNPTSTVLNQYKNCMKAWPLPTKMVTGAALAALGDGLAQSRDKTNSKVSSGKPFMYDTRRTASFASFDACYRMFQHAAFPLIIGRCNGQFLRGLLSMMVPLANAFAESTVTSGTNAPLFLAALERTLAYQLLVVPLLYYPVFFAFTGFMQGLDLRGTWRRAKTNYFPCWKRNLLFWIPVQLFMFGLVDERWQIPFVCVMGVIWSMILSVTAGRATKRSA